MDIFGTGVMFGMLLCALIFSLVNRQVVEPEPSNKELKGAISENSKAIKKSVLSPYDPSVTYFIYDGGRNQLRRIGSDSHVDTPGSFEDRLFWEDLKRRLKRDNDNEDGRLN